MHSGFSDLEGTRTISAIFHFDWVFDPGLLSVGQFVGHLGGRRVAMGRPLLHRLHADGREAGRHVDDEDVR